MKTWKTKLWAVLLGLATAAALGFGASQAAAAARGDDACTWNPPNELGFCASQSTCRTLCGKYAGSSQGANCTNNCCYCLL
jgi:hypothetical protein